MDACSTPGLISAERSRRSVIGSVEAVLSRTGRCKEATWIVELEDLPAGAVAVLLLLVAVLLMLST